jgi:hypothetical protein
MAEAGTLPFELLAMQSAARIAIRLLEKDSNYNSLPLIQRMSDRFLELSGAVLPTVGKLVRRSDREWYAAKPSIVWGVKELVKAGDPSGKVRPIVQQLLSTRFCQSIVLYTDGSKCADTVGAGLHGNGIAQKCSLLPYCSVFSAEAYALRMAVSIPNINNEIVILTDSASCLLALEAGKSKHPWIQEVESIARRKPICFCWIPGHAGINGNNEADRLANEGRAQPPLDIPIPPDDVLSSVKGCIRQHWDTKWYNQRDAKLREIKFSTQKWIDRSNATKHTNATHTFLLKKEAPPNCE